jgi:hypothetical protein
MPSAYMQSPLEDFRLYLRREVASAQTEYDTARIRVLAFTEDRDLTPGPAFDHALADLLEATRIYVGAIRRLAHFAANDKAKSSAKALSHHA